MSEFGTKSADKKIDGLSRNFNTGTAFNIQAGYLFPSNWEVATRFTTVRSDDDIYSGIRDQDQYTLGLSKFVSEHNLKVQTDISRTTSPGVDDGQWMYRIQTEMQF